MSSEKLRCKKIILSGGGTGGSVTPLLAVARELLTEGANLIESVSLAEGANLTEGLNEEKHDSEKNNWDFVFVGTKKGPEKKLVEEFNCLGQKIKFIAIPAGKFRRYFSGQNFIDIFRIFYAFFVSLRLLKKEKPNLFFSAGGFVSVPLAWAAYFLRIPIIIHQQDVRAGLANRLMAPLARLITVTFEKSLQDYGARAVWTGNPSRQAPKDPSVFLGIKRKFNLDPKKSLLVITGGGTGSRFINNLTYESIHKLSEVTQVVHLTGLRKDLEDTKKLLDLPADYQAFEFIANEDAFLLLGAADLVVSRCGLATLTELCELKKPAILIPMPDSHQEENAAVFENAEAAVVLNQADLNAENFTQTIINLLQTENQRQKLSNNIARLMKKEATTVIASFIKEII